MRTPKRAQPERIIRNQIISYLAYVPGWFGTVVSSAGTYSRSKNAYLKTKAIGARVGIPDIMGVWNGKSVCIEVKAPRGKLSEHQRYYLERHRECGGISILARSLDDVMSVIKSSVIKNSL